MGTIFRSISESVGYFASDETWIEGNAIQQLNAIAKLEGIKQVVGMPDLHAGTGYPIGAAFFSVNRFYPALIGGDIGCGMLLVQTDLSVAKLHLDKLEKRLGCIDGKLDINDESMKEKIPDIWLTHPFADALGTIGLGNHFAEFQQVDEIYLPEIAKAIHLDKKSLQLLVHSGSRGFGGYIGRKHIDQFSHNGLSDQTEENSLYLEEHNQALEFARLNRELIAHKILTKTKARGINIIDLFHNYIEPISLNGQTGWLHRKGAAPADKQFAIIPGSRGDYSYLVQTHPQEKSLFSIAHGAGRKWIRTECKGKLANKYTAADLARSRFKSRFICDNKELIYEEAPQAYKSIETIIDTLIQAQLITPIARLKPVLTYKSKKGDNQ